MKITRKQLRTIIAEQIATVDKDAIEDVVMKVLSDEGGAAGLDPIEAALAELEDDEISLPDESIEDIIDDVPGVKRHADGDYVDTTQLEGRKLRITRSQLREIIAETLDLEEDVRKRGNEWCAYVDDKLTKAEKENNPKKHKGKKVGSIQRTKSGKPRMKARACYRSKKKANNAMAAAMMG